MEIKKVLVEYVIEYFEKKLENEKNNTIYKTIF